MQKKTRQEATSLAGLKQSTWAVAFDAETRTAVVVLSFTPIAAHLGLQSIAYAKQHTGKLCTDTDDVDHFKLVLACDGDEETRKMQNECVGSILPQNTMRALALAGCV
jgi:hypothetical protein